MSTIAERSKRIVNVGEFANTGLPEKLGRLNLKCPLERQYILRMPVRIDAVVPSEVPEELEWLEHALLMANAHQVELGIFHPFCYITVRHGIVDSQTDDEWHVDGFSTKKSHVPEQNYVWCSEVGTEYVPLSVNFPTDFDPLKHNVNKYLSMFVNDSAIAHCEAKTLYCFDPYILHRRPPTTAGMMRTFLRISFVPIEINDVNNTQNPALPRTYTQDGVKHRDTLVAYESVPNDEWGLSFTGAAWLDSQRRAEEEYESWRPKG